MILCGVRQKIERLKTRFPKLPICPTYPNLSKFGQHKKYIELKLVLSIKQVIM